MEGVDGEFGLDGELGGLERGEMEISDPSESSEFSRTSSFGLALKYNLYIFDNNDFLQRRLYANTAVCKDDILQRRPYVKQFLQMRPDEKKTL